MGSCLVVLLHDSVACIVAILWLLIAAWLCFCLLVFVACLLLEVSLT
jgi:hypothetical protein